MQDTLFRSLAQEGSLEEEMATHPVLCLENFMDRGAWRAIVPGVTELNVTR